jgi:hypothetical protein
MNNNDRYNISRPTTRAFHDLVQRTCKFAVGTSCFSLKRTKTRSAVWPQERERATCASVCKTSIIIPVDSSTDLYLEGGSEQGSRSELLIR